MQGGGYTTIICTSKSTVLRVFENHGWWYQCFFFPTNCHFFSTKTSGNFLGILKEKSVSTFANVFFFLIPVFLYHKIWGGGVGGKKKQKQHCLVVVYSRTGFWGIFRRGPGGYTIFKNCPENLRVFSTARI